MPCKHENVHGVQKPQNGGARRLGQVARRNTSSPRPTRGVWHVCSFITRDNETLSKVIVTGRANCGKSSLFNAVLGRRALLPTSKKAVRVVEQWRNSRLILIGCRAGRVRLIFSESGRSRANLCWSIRPGTALREGRRRGSCSTSTWRPDKSTFSRSLLSDNSNSLYTG